MSDPYDHSPEAGYLYNRAEQELNQAQQAIHPAAVKAHYLLAGYYLDRVYGSPESASAPPIASYTASSTGSETASGLE
ncbi:hypothetical protein KOF26_05160 [Sphingomonas sp. XMGL2]|uniref:Uncharacterized protein n=2 Tax=Sphingomonas quercus TaxID=2842451 RepID=A0ABS6BG32_9SPHN|nr:hypothetical protein [Sphingomonas quercus]